MRRNAMLVGVIVLTVVFGVGLMASADGDHYCKKYPWKCQTTTTLPETTTTTVVETTTTTEATTTTTEPETTTTAPEVTTTTAGETTTTLPVTYHCDFETGELVEIPPGHPDYPSVYTDPNVDCPEPTTTTLPTTTTTPGADPDTAEETGGTLPFTDREETGAMALIASGLVLVGLGVVGWARRHYAN
jgi:hypothetical protein